MTRLTKTPTIVRKPVTGRRSAQLGLVITLAGLLSGCGTGSTGGGDNEDAGAGGEAGASDSTAQSSARNSGHSGEGGGGNGSTNAGAGGVVDCDQRKTESIVLNESIFHSGFEVTLGSAALTPATESCSPGELVVDATFRNRGNDAHRFDAEMILTSGGHDYTPRSFFDDTPNVPGERTGKGTLHFAVDSDFVLNEATLIVGRASQHRAVIPLGSKSPDAFVSLEPLAAPLAGKFTAGTLVLDMKGGYIRTDLPWDHATLDKKHYSVVLLFSATYATSTGTNSGDYIDDENFNLRLPDGTAVASDEVPFTPIHVLGTTVDDLYAVFTVPGPMEGKFVLEANGEWGEKHAPVSITMPIEVPHIATFGK